VEYISQLLLYLPGVVEYIPQLFESLENILQVLAGTYTIFSKIKNNDPITIGLFSNCYWIIFINNYFFI